MSTRSPEVVRRPQQEATGACNEPPQGASPPIPIDTSAHPATLRRRLRVSAVAVWIAAALVLGALLMWSAHSAGPLDDPDLAMQRAGMLDVVGARSVAPAGIQAAGRPGVVFFVRPAQLGQLQAALDGRDGHKLAASADLSIVVSATPTSGAQRASSAPVVADPGGLIATGYQMRRPRDGGPPVGYTVVGPDRTVRFRTEDPGMSGRLAEVLTMVKALP